jgi:hypothetical protein
MMMMMMTTTMVMMMVLVLVTGAGKTDGLTRIRKPIVNGRSMWPP